MQLLMDMENIASASTTNAHSTAQQLLMDECELFDEYEDRLSRRSYYDDDGNDMTRGKHIAMKREKSSHELVEMAFDGKTPKRLRDGKFGELNL